MNDCPVQVGDMLAGKYRVERVLGQGGMGVVVAAWHVELEQRVAVKFLLPQFASDVGASERFRREARAAVKIRNQHVAKVIDVGTMDSDVPYMVMEFLEGRDLQSELESEGCFPVEVGVEFVLQACLAMAEAHAKGLVHRDLKPANLFRTTGADGSNLVKVLDFGISKSIQSGASSSGQLSLTRTAAMMGSPLYMSPEQLESARDVDERTDIWSLGVILFELVTGCVPFTGDSLPQLVRSVLQGTFPAAHELQPSVPAALSDVIARCLLHDRQDRFASVADLATALAPFCPNGESYAERVRRVLKLSAQPSAAHTPLRLPVASTQPMDRPSVSGSVDGGADASVDAVSAASGPNPPTSLDVQMDEASEIGDTSNTRVDPPPELMGKTVGSWGTTHGGRTAPRPMVRRATALIVAGVLVGGAILAWVGLGSDGAPDVQAAGESGHAVAAGAEQPLEPAVVPQPVAEEHSREAQEAEPPVVDVVEAAPDEPEAEANEGQAGEAAGAATVAGVAKEPVAVAPVTASADNAPNGAAKRVVTQPKKPAAKPRPKPALAPKAVVPKKDPNGFTDFGGRR